ncbi:hypothetical protein CHAB381_0048 [Campylobacter hominis ATCC BAA-381]|uniref:Uncharacterized protein n=1 Tax=Campylobacter hominis (strain ATCC BAA-381 / DSM 21671 / CCUG 45161 / LMG 19568 / NCTC 13146 / CH001A) TaxID=360107 RepID=A7HZH8_CAMHC|nr:hypothetical protein CHAB381_0048 [Campylobacter hominis ATCC BAA-381]
MCFTRHKFLRNFNCFLLFSKCCCLRILKFAHLIILIFKAEIYAKK